MDIVVDVVGRTTTVNGIRPNVRTTYGYRIGEWEEIDDEMYTDGPGVILPVLGEKIISDYERKVLDLVPLTDDEILHKSPHDTYNSYDHLGER